MVDRQALFEKFLAVLQTEPSLPEYLGEEPESASPFDPYQMVAEWIALRHEIKQQGKLSQAAQNALQKALEELQAEKAHLQQQLATSQQQDLTQSNQKSLWLDLLAVVDALEQACNHWQEQIEVIDQTQPQAVAQLRPFWKRWFEQLTQSNLDKAMSAPSSLRDVLVSNQQGVDLIRRSLLDVLRQQQVVPINAKEHPFDPKTMYAIGRQSSPSFPENTVIQEVVRGYMWGDQVLREAQVIVAAKQG
ncbi:MAG: nucleotide exchange factor GrpE [Gloeobacterales cyanobacterium]